LYIYWRYILPIFHAMYKYFGIGEQSLQSYYNNEIRGK
jgi:hypothetical protein